MRSIGNNAVTKDKYRKMTRDALWRNQTPESVHGSTRAVPYIPTTAYRQYE